MENSLFRLDGDVAIVTGIGEAVAKTFADAGAVVVGSNRSPEPRIRADKIIDSGSLSGL